MLQDKTNKKLGNLNSENILFFLLKIKEHLHREMPFLWVRRLNTINMSVFQKLIYIFNTMPIKIPAGFLFAETNKTNSKIHMEMQKV